MADAIASLSYDPWNALRRRTRIQWWLADLGSDDDPATVELVEVDGVEYGPQWSAFWVSYLGQRVDDASADDARTISVGGVTMIPWGVRVNRDDCQAFIEFRHHPWGTGRPDLCNLDPYRPADNQRVLSGLKLLGYRRRRGRYALSEQWDAERFHAEYRSAVAKVPTRRGRRPRQVDIAAEMNISERHLRRLLDLFGLPDE